jgi:hypothetical protein
MTHDNVRVQTELDKDAPKVLYIRMVTPGTQGDDFGLYARRYHTQTKIQRERERERERPLLQQGIYEED